MAAVVRILCGPAGSGKTWRLIERYREVARATKGAALWIGSTLRNVLSLEQRLFSGLEACIAPHLLTFQDFVEEIIRVNDPGARPLSNVQRRLLADDLVAQLHAQGELSHFQRVADTRGFAEGVFAFLAELKRNEIWPEHLAQAMEDRSTGQRAGPPVSLKERQCLRIYTEYQDRLIRHHLYDLEGRFWYARDLLARGRCQPFEAVRAVFVDGFSDFTRVQQEILEALAHKAEEVWITLPGAAGNERAELFTRPRATLEGLQRLCPRVEFLEGNAKPGGLHPALAGGLKHLERQLFRPLRALEQAHDADGLVCIEAPGQLGETRLVAQRIKSLLLSEVLAEDIVVTSRELLPYVDLIREVFDEYGIPIDIEGIEPLIRNPAVAALLRALRLRDEEWPFAGVTALLRSDYFRPDWPETREQAEVALQGEALLRLIGEPRDRTAYLKAVDHWADHPSPGLEDEQAEESRRQRMHQLAVRCRPFLKRFFEAWDDRASRAALADHVAWLREFTDNLGLTQAAAERPRDSAALARLWLELDQWTRLERQLCGADRSLDFGQFVRLLGAVVNEAGLARTARGPGRVRVLSAALARGLEAPYLFLMGLSERNFPRLAVPEPFFDEAERQSFKEAGLDFSCLGDLLPDEMLLFYQVVTRARKQLVLSYPAVDGKGQDLLPSSFLAHVLDCFGKGAIRVEQRRMLIQGYNEQEPLSPAEHRVQVAALLSEAGTVAADLDGDLADNLAAAAQVSRQRFRIREFGCYDGLLRDPAIVAALQQQFGPEKVFSPTSLEEYIACPFRFFLGQVLRLEPLEEPREEIESTQRGAAFHRALSRLHRQFHSDGVHEPTEAVAAELERRLDEAVEEYAKRSSSPASAMLWRLEGKRLRRLAARYQSHWEEFIKPWRPHQASPRPQLFEEDFGMTSAGGKEVLPLVIQVDGIEVRLRGRIDRVDVAELDSGLGFWIIDYKTGRSSHYTPTDLKTFRRLQLTLYALAVERVLLAEQGARPLGLAYWLVADDGPKPALPSGKQLTSWLLDEQSWDSIRAELERWVTELAVRIRHGAFPLSPRAENCTETCDFGHVCRIAQSRSVEKPWPFSLPVIS